LKGPVKSRGIVAEPSTQFRVHVSASLNGGGTRTCSYAPGELDARATAFEVAHARTWILEQRLGEIGEGKLKGFHRTNCLSVRDLQAAPHNEMVRHKLLDLLGDIFPLGYVPSLSIKAENPNHRINHLLLATLQARMHNLRS
jgi:UDP-3-O-acyl-N-acetylglucosamine deacetylase